MYLDGKEARTTLMRGIKRMYDSVSATLGPMGRTVLLERGYGLTEPTKDGVTVAEEVFCKDKFEGMGAQLVREASQKANTEAGDATTTAIVLAYNMAKEGLSEVDKRANVYQIGKGMKLASDEAVKELEAITQKIETEEDFAKVATISTQDEDIGKIIAKTFVDAGQYGCIDIERSDIPGIRAEKTEGISFDKGCDSKTMFQYYLTDLNKKKCVVEDVPILVVEDKIENDSQIFPILTKLATDKGRIEDRFGWNFGVRKIVIISDDFSGTGMGTMIANNRLLKQSGGREGFHIVFVQAPSFGPNKVEIMQDIAAVTGATFISREHGNRRVENADLSCLGRAKRVTVEDKRTIILSEMNKGDWGDVVKSKIEDRITLIKAELADMPNDHVFKPQLLKRLATLTDGVSVLKVGSESENERNELRRRVEDGVRAVRSAREEGVTPGCGVGLLKCIPRVQKLMETAKNEDQRKGMDIVRRALASVSLRLLEVGYIENFDQERSGWFKEKYAISSDDYRKNLVMRMIEEGLGYNFEKDELTDMMKLGVYDAKKAVRVALQSATSAALTFLKIECVIASDNEDERMFERLREKLSQG